MPVFLKFCLLSASIFAIVINGYGQESFFKIFTNNGYDYGQGVVQLADSSFLITGSSSSFDDSPSEAFLLKLNKSGDFQWSKNYGGNENDWGRRILNWNDSIFFVVGHSNSLGTGSYNFFMVKTDSVGNEITEKHFNHSGWDKMNDAIFSSDSSIYMVGETSGNQYEKSNFYIVKTNEDGDTIWTKNFGSSGDDAFNAIRQYDATTYYAVGYKFNVDSAFTKGAVVKFDNNGTILEEFEFGSSGNYFLNDFFIQSGNLNAVGIWMDSISPEIDHYRLQIGLSGNVISELCDHNPATTIFDHVLPYGTTNKVYISSYYDGQFTEIGGMDANIITFFDNLSWDGSSFINVGFPGIDKNEEIAPTNDESVVVVGYMTMPGMGGSSVFVYKIGPNYAAPMIDLEDLSANQIYNLVNLDETNSVQSDFSIYPNPTNGMIQFKTSVDRTVELVDLNGQTLYLYSIQNGSTIDLSTLSKGMYFIRVLEKNMIVNSIKLSVN